MRLLIYLLILLSTPALAAPRQAKLPAEFDAQVLHVIDGDTFQFKTSLLNVDINETCRMKEYNAPELHGPEKPEGTRAKDKLISLIGGKKIHIVTLGREKYGRMLCTASTGTVSIGAAMREHLKAYIGRDKYLKKQPHQ